MQSDSTNRGIVTMAFGPERFIEMAKWFAMSLKVNAPQLPTAILTDSHDAELTQLYTYVIPYQPTMGNYMEPKFHLDRFAPFEESLYVDADCLAVTDLNKLFDLFRGQYFGIPGWRYLTRTDQDPNVDVAQVLDHFGLSSLAKFNGGCYFFRRSPETTAFFSTARDLFSKAKSLKIGSYSGGGFSDEPLFALALGIHGLSLTPTGTGGPWTPIDSRGRIHLDILEGRSHFCKEGLEVFPDIIHFPFGYRECWAYRREVWKLKKHFGKPLPPFHVRAKAFATALLWAVKMGLKNRVKDILRRNQVRMVPPSVTEPTRTQV